LTALEAHAAGFAAARRCLQFLVLSFGLSFLFLELVKLRISNLMY